MKNLEQTTHLLLEVPELPLALRGGGGGGVSQRRQLALGRVQPGAQRLQRRVQRRPHAPAAAPPAHATGQRSAPGARRPRPSASDDL